VTSKRALEADISALIKVREDTIALLERFAVARSEQPSRLRLTSSDFARCLAAHFATTLEPDDNTPLPKAFRELKLNPDDPWDWRRLAQELALLCFGGRGRGRPEKDENFRHILILHRERIIRTDVAEKREKNGLRPKKLTDSEVASYLKKNGGYENVDESSLPTRLREARSAARTDKALRTDLKGWGITVPAKRPRRTGRVALPTA
jgi:hypothetical protein